MASRGLPPRSSEVIRTSPGGDVGPPLPAARHGRPDPVGSGRQGEADPGHDHQHERGHDEQADQPCGGGRTGRAATHRPSRSEAVGRQAAQRQPEPGDAQRADDPGSRQAEERVEQEAAMEASDQRHEAGVVVAGAVDAGPGRVDVKGTSTPARPHLDHVDAVADGGGGEDPHFLARVVLADDGQDVGGTPVAGAVAGQVRAGASARSGRRRGGRSRSGSGRPPTGRARQPDAGGRPTQPGATRSWLVLLR